MPQPQQQLPRERRREPENNRGAWPPLNSYDTEKMGSLHSVYTPYPPTIENFQPTRRHRDSTSENDKAFLEKLMENLKKGIIEQMDSKMTELRNQIPSIIQETQWNQQSRTRQTSSQSQGPLQMPHHPQLPAQMVAPNHPIQMPMSMNLIPNYLGPCF